MAEQDVPKAERTQDLDRLLTFVDAIVAIAITLLVLPLAELAGEVDDGQSVWQLLQDHAGQFGAFLLSFVVIARIWMAQHRIVRGARDTDRRLAAWLITWSLTIVFLPFPTALLSNAGSQAATKVLYFGTLALSAALLALIAVDVRRVLPPGSPARPSTVNSTVDAVTFVVALVLSLVFPVLSYYPLLLLVWGGRLERVIRRRRQAGRA